MNHGSAFSRALPMAKVMMDQPLDRAEHCTFGNRAQSELLPIRDTTSEDRGSLSLGASKGDTAAARRAIYPAAKRHGTERP